MTTAIAKHEGNGIAHFFTPEQEQMVRDSFASGANREEFAVFMEVCRARRLNPILRQIHLVKRWNGELKREVCTPQVGIDGLRAIAERTGKYDGQDEPEFIYDGQGATRKLICAKVRVYRKDFGHPVTGVAHFTEYAQTKKDGGLTRMWADKPHVMLAKCAEALALRKAFPEDTSGLYTDAEMPEVERREPITVEAKPVEVSSVKDQIRQLAKDYHFDVGDKERDLWALVKSATNKSKAAEITDTDFQKIEALMSATVAAETAGLDPEPPADLNASAKDNDIPF